MAYWEQRYLEGGTSGSGSCGRVAEFKAEVVNGLVFEETVQSVIEFGCGDGHQVSLARYPRYLGLDVSPTALSQCARLFHSDHTKRFALYEPFTFSRELHRRHADLTLSLDVIYHLVEDEVYELHLKHLFGAAERFVVIFSSDREETPPAPHIRHRAFSHWILAHCPQWRLLKRIANPYPEESGADFFVFVRRVTRQH